METTSDYLHGFVCVFYGTFALLQSFKQLKVDVT